MSLHVDIHGAGPDVVLLHGLPMRPGAMMQIGGWLTATHRVIVPSLPGYRPSPGMAPYDQREADRQLAAALRSAGVGDDACYVGYSGGAYRALRLALFEGVRPRAFLGLAPAAGPSSEAARLGMRGYAALVRSGQNLEAAARGAAPAAFFEARPDLWEELLTWTAAGEPEHIAAELEAYAGADDLCPSLGRVDAPSLLVVGDADPLTPLAEVERIHAALPNASLRVLPGCGHFLPWEAEGVLQATLRELVGAAPT